MHEILIQSFELFRASLEKYTGGNYIWLLYPVALLVILIWGRKGDRLFFLGVLAVEAFVVFNPILAALLARGSGGFGKRYHRFFWMVIFYITIAYAMVLLLNKIKNKYICLLASLLIGVTIVWLGNPVFFGKNAEPYVKATNHYFIKDEILEVAELLHSEGKEVPRVLYGDLILFYRQYDPSVFSVTSRIDFEYITTHTLEEFRKDTSYGEHMKRIIETYFYADFSTNKKLFQRSLRKWGVDYVVSDSVYFDEYIQDTNLKMLGKTENYTVWKMP